MNRNIALALLITISLAVTVSADDRKPTVEDSNSLLRLLPESAEMFHSGQGLPVLCFGQLPKLKQAVGDEVIEVMRLLRGNSLRSEDQGEVSGVLDENISLTPPRYIFALEATREIVQTQIAVKELSSQQVREALRLVVMQANEPVTPPPFEELSLSDTLRRREINGSVMFEITRDVVGESLINRSFAFALVGQRTAIFGPRDEVSAALKRWEAGKVLERFQFINPQPFYWVAIVPHGSAKHKLQLLGWDPEGTSVDEQWLGYIYSVCGSSISIGRPQLKSTTPRAAKTADEHMPLVLEVRMLCSDAAHATRFANLLRDDRREWKELFPFAFVIGKPSAAQVQIGRRPDVIIVRMTSQE